jgi:hypothetical protein
MVNIFGEFCMEMFPMKWTLKLERIDEPRILRSTVGGPHRASRADLRGGPRSHTRDDGKYLIRQAQSEIAHDQVRAIIAKPRPCACCGQLRAIKDHRRRRIDTVFGHLRIHGPRYEACACGGANVSSPVAGLFPHRSTFELRHLQVE